MKHLLNIPLTAHRTIGDWAAPHVSVEDARGACGAGARTVALLSLPFM